MNDLERRSFYSFLGLYIISSLLFISLIGYWYYMAEKRSLEKERYYKLQHIADKRAGDIIYSQMKNKPLVDMSTPDDVTLALIDIEGRVKEGRLVVPDIKLQKGYFITNGYNIMVSDAPKEHLGIKYVVVQSDSLSYQLRSLQGMVLKIMIAVFILVAIIAWMLSKIFMRPIRQKVEQIENFINDVTHELNTPITGLSIATEQALKQNKCTVNTLKNISISTKQLYDIYRSLTYLNFSSAKDEEEDLVDIAQLLKSSIEYYKPLCDIKKITVISSIEDCNFKISPTKLQLLYGNLIGNAIKYSPAKSTITITLINGVVGIKDQGIGIEPSKQKDIFKKYKRGTEYSGGFGIGLSIVKSICDEYGIKIEFRLYFPTI